MPAVMFDSDTPDLFLEPMFAGVRVATYADLVTPALIGELAGRLVVIDRGHGDPHNLATVADIEDGLLTPAEGAAKIHQWLQERRPFPTAYHDRSHQAAVDQALGGAPARHWVATLDGTLLPDGVRRSAVQFAGEAVLGFHADISLVWDDGWHPIPDVEPAAALASMRRFAADANASIAQIMSLAAHF